MGNKRSVEIGVGIFVAAGLLALLMLALQVSNLGTIGREPGYTLFARFDNIGGLRVRSPVTMAGVRVGQVTDIRVDAKTYEAVVTMNVSTSVADLPVDTSASILTSGLLGENYVGLEPGGEDRYLKDGDEIRLTQSALILEQVLGQFLFSRAAGEQ